MISLSSVILYQKPGPFIPNFGAPGRCTSLRFTTFPRRWSILLRLSWRTGTVHLPVVEEERTVRKPADKVIAPLYILTNLPMTTFIRANTL